MLGPTSGHRHGEMRLMGFGSWLAKEARITMKANMRSLRHGGSVDAVMKERKKARAEERADRFGTGEVYGDRNWSEPVHATTLEGRPMTVPFGRGPRDGQTLVAPGHVSAQSFYGTHKDGKKGHDHFLIDGEVASESDRMRWVD